MAPTLAPRSSPPESRHGLRKRPDPCLAQSSSLNENTRPGSSHPSTRCGGSAPSRKMQFILPGRKRSGGPRRDSGAPMIKSATKQLSPPNSTSPPPTGAAGPSARWSAPSASWPKGSVSPSPTGLPRPAWHRPESVLGQSFAALDRAAHPGAAQVGGQSARWPGGRPAVGLTMVRFKATARAVAGTPLTPCRGITRDSVAPRGCPPGRRVRLSRRPSLDPGRHGGRRPLPAPRRPRPVPA